MKKALFFLTCSTFSGAGLAFFTQMILAKSLSTIDYGMFIAALSLVTILAPLSGFGIGALWLKVFGQEGWNGLRWIKPSLRFTLLSNIMVMVIIWGWALGTSHDYESIKILLILSVFATSQGVLENVSSIFQLEEKYIYLATWQAFPSVARFFILAICFLMFPENITAVTAAGIYFITAIVLVVAGNKILFRARKGNIALKGHPPKTINNKGMPTPTIVQVIDQAWPFGIAGAFYLVYFQGGTVLVKYFLGNEMAGQYGMAMVFMTAIYMFPGIIYQKFLLPKMHRWAHNDKIKMLEAFRLGNRVMLFFGSIVAFFLYYILPLFLIKIFSDQFLVASELIPIMVFAIPIKFLASSMGAVLVTKENMKIKVYCMGGVALISTVMTILLMKVFGVFGAAYAALITETLLLLIYSFSVKKYVFYGVENVYF